jgi:hypothetical protein
VELGVREMKVVMLAAGYGARPAEETTGLARFLQGDVADLIVDDSRSASATRSSRSSVTWTAGNPSGPDRAGGRSRPWWLALREIRGDD